MTRALPRICWSAICIYILLLLPGLILGSCAFKEDPSPPIATEQQGMRLLRAVTANIATPTPPIAELREHPAIKLALSEYAKPYPDATDGQFAFLRWWSSRYQDIDITPEMRDAATVIPLLLPEADDTVLEQTLVDYPQLIFVYDPPLHQPDVDVLAVFLAKDPGLFKTIYNDSSASIGAIQPIVVEQAMSRLILAGWDPTAESLPIGLRLVSTEMKPQWAGALCGDWIEATILQWRTELKTGSTDQPLNARVIGQPFERAGRQAILQLLYELDPEDPVRSHPALIVTTIAAIRAMLGQSTETAESMDEVTRWAKQPSWIYPAGADSMDPDLQSALTDLHRKFQGFDGQESGI